MKDMLSKLYTKIRDLLFIRQEIKIQICQNKHCKNNSLSTQDNREKITKMWK